MAEKKIRVGILFGGKSAEHEISLLSAKNVIEALDKTKYEPILIGINKSGEWFFHEDLNRCLMNPDNAKLIELRKVQESVALVPKESGSPLVSLTQAPQVSNNSNKNSINNTTNNNIQNKPLFERALDVVFPVLHGTNGEDGTVQGLLKLANIPFVGASVLSSAISMDKDVMKRLLRDAGIPIARFITVDSDSQKNITFEEVTASLGLPLFIKPANLGSSVGVYKVKSKEEFYKRIQSALQYDRKILIEEYIPGREIECSVLGNENPIASLPGEIIPQHEFYSYEAKYLDENGARLEVPAKMSNELIKKIQALSIETAKVLCVEGMARVDMFLKEDGSIIINEINTIPGFTKISMYPKMWEASGKSYPKLIDELIQLALKRYEKEQALKTVFDFD